MTVRLERSQVSSQLRVLIAQLCILGLELCNGLRLDLQTVLCCLQLPATQQPLQCKVWVITLASMSRVVPLCAWFTVGCEQRGGAGAPECGLV